MHRTAPADFWVVSALMSCCTPSLVRSEPVPHHNKEEEEQVEEEEEEDQPTDLSTKKVRMAITVGAGRPTHDLLHIVINAVEHGPLVDHQHCQLLEYLGELFYRLGDGGNLMISASPNHPPFDHEWTRRCLHYYHHSNHPPPATQSCYSSSSSSSTNTSSFHSIMLLLLLLALLEQWS